MSLDQMLTSCMPIRRRVSFYEQINDDDDDDDDEVQLL